MYFGTTGFGDQQVEDSVSVQVAQVAQKNRCQRSMTWQ
jgi:hypothetical protein